MSDIGSGFRPRRLHLLEGDLQLDPDLLTNLLALEAEMATTRHVNFWLDPDWAMDQIEWQRILAQPIGHPAGPGFAPGAGPAVPRAGELSDVAEALYGLPAVQTLVRRAHDEGRRQLRRLGQEWERSSPGERALMVTMASLVSGSMVGFVLWNQPSREAAFHLIQGHDIPVPGVDGLSFQVLDHGVSVTGPLGVRGLSGTASLQVPGGGARPDVRVIVTLDVMEYLRSRR